MNKTRTEHDGLGQRELPQDALHGIHTSRALENFDLAQRAVPRALVHAYGAVKLAAAETNHALGMWDDETSSAIAGACRDLMEGRLDDHIVVDALQGGAGTSTNMNVNEVIANCALEKLGHPHGQYDVIHPTEDVNRHQSTNDTYPTALRVAAIQGIRQAEQAVIELQEAFQAQEESCMHVTRVARTQLQDAVLTTMGRQMSAYADALTRDRWRIYKCEERLRIVNLGGTAIGSGITAPPQFIFRVVDRLKHITGIGLARAENLVDATQNVDVFVEVSGILGACATTLTKICADLRLLSSGPDAGFGELRLPPRQAGSSIMPGKVNPVIPEAATQAAMVITANHTLIAHAAGSGNLELNPFLPVIADRLLESIGLLARACRMLARFCVLEIEVDEARCQQHVDTSTATVTALVGAIGYKEAEEIALSAAREGQSIRQAAIASSLVTAEQFDELVSPEAVMRLGTPVEPFSRTVQPPAGTVLENGSTKDGKEK